MLERRCFADGERETRDGEEELADVGERETREGEEGT